MTNNLTMEDLYKKLNSLGFSKKFIRAIGLPSWWTDELDNSTDLSVVYEAAGYISHRLYIDLKSLIDICKKAKFVGDVTYNQIIETLISSKEYLFNHPLRKEEIDLLSDNELDYYEQLLLLEL